MSVRGSEFHNGIEDEDAINAFIEFLKAKYPVIKTENNPTPDQQPTPSPVNYNPEPPINQQPTPTPVNYGPEPPPSEQPVPSSTK